MARIRRTRGKKLPGTKWVDGNFDAKFEIQEKCGGILPAIPAYTTSDFEGSDEWSDEHLPDILFYLRPPRSQFSDYDLQPVLDENGEAIMSPHKAQHEIRAISVLPDQISLDVPGWMITAWRRLDSRITLQDILDRMTTDLGDAQKFTEKKIKLPTKNSLQNRCMRDCRRALKYYSDYGRRGEPHKTEVEAIEVLTMNNILYNTTLTYHPQFHRLIKVKFFRKAEGCKYYVKQMEVTQENLEETTYPLDYFLHEDYVPELTDSMKDALNMLSILQERAIRHGLNPSYWKKLGRSCVPITWFDRCKDKTPPNETYDGGCDICTWTRAGDETWHTVDFNRPPRRAPKKKKGAKVESDKIESENEELDSYGEQSEPEEIDDALEMEDTDEMPSDIFTSSPEKMLLSHQKSQLSTTSPLKRRRVDEQNSSPTKRLAPTPADADEAEPQDNEYLQTGAWDIDQSNPFIINYNQGYQPANLIGMPHTPPAMATNGYDHNQGLENYAAPHQIFSPSEQEDHSQQAYPGASFEARLRSSAQDFTNQHVQTHDASEVQSTSTTDAHQPLYDSQNFTLDNSSLAASFELDENDPDLTNMLDWCRTLAQSNSQPQQPAALAAGIG